MAYFTPIAFCDEVWWFFSPQTNWILFKQTVFFHYLHALTSCYWFSCRILFFLSAAQKPCFPSIKPTTNIIQGVVCMSAIFWWCLRLLQAGEGSSGFSWPPPREAVLLKSWKIFYFYDWALVFPTKKLKNLLLLPIICSFFIKGRVAISSASTLLCSFFINEKVVVSSSSALLCSCYKISSTTNIAAS
jgi:hypothetical protein